MSAHPYYERHWHEDDKPRRRLSRETKENLLFTAIATGSLIGIGLVWWLG